MWKGIYEKFYSLFLITSQWLSQILSAQNLLSNENIIYVSWLLQSFKVNMCKMFCWRAV